MLDLQSLLKVPHVDPEMGFDLSPDGGMVAFSWNLTGRWEIYLGYLNSARPPELITSGEGAKFAPIWSSDGLRLAYVRDLDGGERYDIFSYELGKHEHVILTRDTDKSILPSLSWSPDDDWIAYVSDRFGRFDTYIMPARGGDPRRVLNLDYPDWEVRWSPDGKCLAVVCEAQGQDYETFIVPLNGDDPFPLSGSHGPICAKQARWSPKSNSLAFSSDAQGSFQVGVFDLKSKEFIWVSKGDGEAESPAWSHDGHHLAYVLSEGPVTRLAVSDLRTVKQRTFQIESGVHYHPQFLPGDDELLLAFDNPRYPTDLWLLSLKSGEFRQLTDSLPEQFGPSSFVMPKQVEYPGHDEGKIPALLYEPKREAKSRTGGIGELHPGLIYIHGGPSWLSQFTWDPLLQHMVSRGWFILAPNYRGSTGYGRAWQLANRFDLGGGDTDDVAAGALYLRNLTPIDPENIALTGRSYGGYLTMTCLTKYPDRWAAGSAVVPFLNWFTSHENSREDLQHWDLENFGDPDTNYDLWYEHSPYFYLDRVRAPVQLISGAHDVRCPASESIQAHKVMKGLGLDTDYVLYEDEGHSFLKIENRIDAETRRVDFLAKNLEG
jgi:dipeptidyl aminopeptidase/acylaminoacyl peptidase